jgi:hypothetical protein
MSDSQMCILCRGSSVIQAKKYFYNLSGEMLVVNEFNEELKNDFIDRLFREKDITHIVSRDSGLSNLKLEYYKKYNIEKIILNIFKEEFDKNPPMRYLLESRGLNTDCLPDALKPFQKKGGGFPTTGVISIVYATVALKKKDIHICGMDFYEKDYFANIQVNSHQKKKGEVMKFFMQNFMEKFPEVKYTFYTNSSFTSGLDNAIIIND